MLCIRVPVQPSYQMVLAVLIWLKPWLTHRQMTPGLRAMILLPIHERIFLVASGETDILCLPADLMSTATQNFSNSQRKLALMNTQLEVVTKMSCWRKGRLSNSTMSARSAPSRCISSIVQVKASLDCFSSKRIAEHFCVLLYLCVQCLTLCPAFVAATLASSRHHVPCCSSLGLRIAIGSRLWDLHVSRP